MCFESVKMFQFQSAMAVMGMSLQSATHKSATSSPWSSKGVSPLLSDHLILTVAGVVKQSLFYLDFPVLVN